MIVIVNGEERYYNDSYLNKFNKYFKISMIWNLIFAIIICFGIPILFINESYYSTKYVLYLAFANFIISQILMHIKSKRKYDYDYIENYYPVLNKKLWPLGRSNGLRGGVAFSLYSDEDNIIKGADPALDIISKKAKNSLLLGLAPILTVILMVFVIIISVIIFV